MSFEIAILGSSGTYPSAGRMCSGYLFRAGDTRVVVDCGHGSVGNLQRHARLEDVDAFVISHGHADHCVDLIGVYYALKFHPDGPRSVDVYAPEGVQDRLACMLSGDSSQTFSEVCRFHEVRGGDHVEIGALAFDLHPSVHPLPTISVRASHGGRAATYSGDSAGGSDLVEAARDADLFICEATYPGDPDDHPEGLHLTGMGAGEVARKADVGRLALTHLWPRVDRDRMRREAESTFGADVSLVEDGEIWEVV